MRLCAGWLRLSRRRSRDCEGSVAPPGASKRSDRPFIGRFDMATAATSEQRFLDPRVLSRLSNLQLVAKTVVEGFLIGLHRSPYYGVSIDFAEYRPYSPGDDPRSIDWNVYARSDRYYLKTVS